MVKKIMHDPLFLAQKSVDATEADKQVVTDLLDCNLRRAAVADAFSGGRPALMNGC